MAKLNVSLLSKEFVDSAKNQEFSLPTTILRYIFKAATCRQWQKLQKLCKLFFVENGHLIIRNLTLSSNPKDAYFGKRSLTLAGTSPIFPYLQNIWLSGDFKAHSSITQCTRFISKITRCDITYLSISHYLTDTDFKVLSESGTIEILIMDGVADENGYLLPIEDIISKTPNARGIEIRDCHVTQKTMKNLLGLNHKVQMEYLFLRKVDDTLDVKDFYKFLKMNAAKCAKLWIDFDDDDLHQHASKKFCRRINKKLKTWNPQEEKPIFRDALLCFEYLKSKK